MSSAARAGAAAGAGAGSGVHPHVALVQGVARVLAWWLATPVALWLAWAWLAAGLCTLSGQPGRIGAQLTVVAASEAAQAEALAPALRVPGWGLLPAGWSWRWALACSTRLLPDAAATPAAGTVAARPGLVGRLGAAASRRLHPDRLAERLLLAIIIARALVALAVLLGLAPLVGLALAAAAAGVAAEAAGASAARRARWWWLVARHALAGIAALAGLPVALAMLPAAVALLVITSGALHLARRETLEVSDA